MNYLLIGAFIYLFTAVVSVPICKRLGLGTVLGYLLAGIVIGPVLGIAGEETESLQQVAEFGVVMMLFLVGLELKPSKLWELRYKLIGLGGLQIALSIIAIGLSCYYIFDQPWQTSVAIGCIMSLSSTAIVLQTLDEKNLNSSPGGQSSFAVLLFQDIASIPMMALLPLLALAVTTPSNIHSADNIDLLTGMSGYVKTIVTVVVIALLVVVEHFLSNPILKFLAQVRLREVFTLFTLALVIGIAILMSMIGLSPALGAFIAGMVLANSQYRHVLESNLEPFKGLLMGLFFMTVGAGINYHLLYNKFFLIIGATIGLMLIKMLVLYLLALIFKLRTNDRFLFMLALAQAGEFGFVLIELGHHNQVLPDHISDNLSMIVTISMLLTPLCFIAYDKVIVPWTLKGNKNREADAIEESNPIIIVGHGRYGQVVNSMINSLGFETTIIDNDPTTVDGLNRVGIKTYFGDGSRLELLATAGLNKARLLVVAIDNQEQSISLVREARLAFPKLKIIARSYDRSHTYDLYYAGANSIVRETFDSAIRSASYALEILGIDHYKAKELAEFYAIRDRLMTREMADAYNPEIPSIENTDMQDIAREHLNETSELMQQLWEELDQEGVSELSQNQDIDQHDQFLMLRNLSQRANQVNAQESVEDPHNLSNLPEGMLNKLWPAVLKKGKHAKNATPNASDTPESLLANALSHETEYDADEDETTAQSANPETEEAEDDIIESNQLPLEHFNNENYIYTPDPEDEETPPKG
ncbi:monovalent cation:proton antiporter-2 (CPA2) family protein [Brackiella oedipodis]|uniref:monovalent cation:proton antiporter-2 (CPA2) family protein n=1 Tax=Brackiella oedipodis TaxID=124225 RepID=UPI000A03C92B|nr:monovalent cation:proton antiporter-2 (CPA2) family protein [Brackiella oedipodis]